MLSQPSKRILDTSAKLTDSNSTWIVYCGATTVASPTTIEGVEAPDDVTLLFANIPSFVADIKLIWHPYFRATVLPEHSKAALFADPYTPVATTMDIKAYYDAKNGAPTADTKVFL